MRRALALLGTLGALEVLGLSGPKISLGARGTMFRQPRRRYRPGMRDSELIQKHGKPLPNGIQLYTPKGGHCKAGGGRGLGNKAEARWDALCNLLSWYDENDPVFEYKEAAELKEEAIWRKTHQPPSRSHGFYARIVPGENHDVRGGRTIVVTKEHREGTATRTVLLNRAGADTLRRSTATPPSVRDHLEQFLDGASACHYATQLYLEEQTCARGRMSRQLADDEAAADDAVADEGLYDALRQVCVDSGWRALTREEFMPETEDMEVSYLGSIKCLAHRIVVDSYFGRGTTGPRDGHDKGIKLYREVIGKGCPGYPGAALWRALVKARVPELAKKLADPKTKSKFARVLTNLVSFLAVDHIWSSVVDHPMNCMLEWKQVNGYFGDFNNQPAKLARYGAGVKTASMNFMGAIITGERKLVSLA